MKLSEAAEEVATFYAKMLTHDYTTMEAFNKNFFKDWRKVMTSQERELITDLKKCDFKPMNVYFTEKSEERKNRSKEQKKVEDFAQIYCLIDCNSNNDYNGVCIIYHSILCL